MDEQQETEGQEIDVEKYDESIQAAQNAIHAAMEAISSVPRDVYWSSGDEEAYDNRRALVDHCWEVAQAASQAVWTAHITCDGHYGDLYGAYDSAADAATNCSTARVEESYGAYLDSAYNKFAEALGKLPW